MSKSALANSNIERFRDEKLMAAAKMNGKNRSASESFDVVVIGGGAAGMSAALWSDELGLKTLLLEENDKLGGQLWRVYNPIKNHLGADAENGRKLQKTFLKQIASRKFSVSAKSKISAINLKEKSVVLESGGKIEWKFLVIAVGVRRRKLGVEGEERFQKRGIIESGKRDAELVKNKSVVIVGGGDAALENALILAETAGDVTVVHRRENFRARAEFLAKAKKNKKIKTLTETIVAKFGGGKKLDSVELKDLKTKKTWTIAAEGVLLRIGVEPNTEIFQGKIKLDEQGYIKINENCETSAPNVFAVGDAANPLAPTVSSAVGMGATAAKVIFSKLNS